MKRIALLVGSLIALMSLWAACASHRQAVTTDTSGPCPAWFTTPPQDPQHLYAVATATSKAMGLAVDKAKTGARMEIATQMEARLEALQTKLDQEVGFGEDAELFSQYTQAAEVATTQALKRTRVIEQTTSMEGTIWRSCVLMEMPLWEVDDALVDRIQANSSLYRPLQASETFQEMEEAKEAPVLAVADFHNATGDAKLDYLAASIPEGLVTDLAGRGGLRLVERRRLKDVMEEILFGTSGAVAEAVEMGKQVGATVMVLGSYTVTGDGLQVNARVVDVVSGEIVHGEQVGGKVEEHGKAVRQLGGRLWAYWKGIPMPK